MTGNETQIKIKGRAIMVAVAGLGPLEISNIAGQVEKKIDEIEAKTSIPDTGRLALLAAFEFATELHNLKQHAEASKEADSRTIDELIAKLEGAMEKELF